VFFAGWYSLLKVLVVGVAAYVTLVLFLRVSGKRTLSKMNAFDLIVTVALGSTLATVILSKGVTLADGALAFALLIALQFAITWLSVRVGAVERLVKSDPKLVLLRGELLRDAMRSERVVEGEARQAVRASGHASLESVEAVVLETDGSFSVIGRSDADSATAIKQIGNWPSAR
jgi:uncharacterized membrane protein YcaP (DUF421 family)